MPNQRVSRNPRLAVAESPTSVYPGTSAEGATAFPAAGNNTLTVDYRDIATLIPYARNARVHDDAHVAQIAASIREWGWTMPVLVDEEGGIIAGHGRVLAGQKLGIVNVPVIVARGWSEAKKRAYVLADNKLAINAKWDRDMLTTELAELRDVCDLALLGFSTKELSDLLEGAGTLDAAQQLTGLVYHVIVECAGEDEQGQLLERLQEEGLTCRALIA
jgi:ParB-like chromosome segregation protein Spo0J